MPRFACAFFILIHMPNVLAVSGSGPPGGCLPAIREDGGSPERSRLSFQIDRLLQDPSYQHYHEALRLLRDGFQMRHLHCSIFDEKSGDVAKAIAEIEKRVALVVERIEDRLIPPSLAVEVNSEIYRGLFIDLGYRIFMLEDETAIPTMLRRRFSEPNIKFATSPSLPVTGFWLQHLDRNRTFLFFDAEIEGEAWNPKGEKFAGLKRAVDARGMGFKYVAMVSGQPDEILKGAGKPEDMINLTKPYSLSALMGLVAKWQSESDRHGPAP